ncbi:MAG: hypothetical protein AAB416_02460 [Patescibacteria group bacterium]
MAVSSPKIKVTLDPFVSSCELQSTIHNDPTVARQRAYVRERYGEVAFCFCADRRFDPNLCTEDLVPGWVKPFRSIGANFWAGEQPMQSRIESHLHYAHRSERPCTTYFDFWHTDCAGHKGDPVRARETIQRFGAEKDADYSPYRNSDGTRRLVSIECSIDVRTSAWTMFNGNDQIHAEALLGMDSSGILRAVQDFFGDRRDMPAASIGAAGYVLEEQIKYLRSHEGRGPLSEHQLRPGVILAVGKGFPWVRREDNVYVLGDHHGAFIADLAVPLEAVGNRIGAILTCQTFSETLHEPYRRMNAIRRSQRIADLTHGFLAAHFPDLYDRIPVVSAVFDWDEWMIKFEPELARTCGYRSWTE